ncbi:MAG: tetratricopeptide repeat protein, partial [Chloroflexales bacterium]|nr:tetratricopeptide repeat protein [Chloroflexales bacterium]
VLYLERQAGEPALPIAGADLVHQIADLARRPLLIVLASCRGAGDTNQVLSAVGPGLARAGVGAVMAMQGDVPMDLVAALTPRLFGELSRDGQIDRALAAARSALPTDQPWWMPVLWMAVNDGALWQTPERAPVRGAGVFQVRYPMNPLFRGRDTELEQLAEVLLGEPIGPAAALPALAGTGGIGKTQLASEFAHRHRDDFPGGIFWINMAQPETVASQVAAAGGPGGLDLPGWSGLDFEGKIAAVRRAWNEPVRRLLVFDNLEDPHLLQEWRPTSGGARVLLTTRRGVWTATSGVQAVRLATLARHESIRLLLTPRYGAQVETVLAEPAVAAEAGAICEEVGDLPLALALAGAYLEQTPSLSLAGYHRRLAEMLLAHRSLEAELEEGLPTQHAASVAATIALSYNQITSSSTPKQGLSAWVAKLTRAKPGEALRLLQRIAQLAPAPIPQRLLVRLAERDPNNESQASEVDAPLRRLATVGLVDLLDTGSVAIHRLIATFVRAQDSNGQASAARATASLIDEVYAINEAGYPLRGTPYLPHLVYLEQYAEQLNVKLSATLQTNLGYLLQAQGDLVGARPYFERALVIREQTLGTSHLATANSLHNLGYLLQAQGDLVGARPYCERALAICEQTLGPSHPITANSLNNLGTLLQARGDLEGAQPYLERALAIREQTLGTNHPDTAQSFNNLGMLLEARSDLEGAQPYLERALAIREQTLGLNHPDTAQSFNNLGELLRSQGDLSGARPYLERALAIREQTLGPVHAYMAHSLNNLGALLQAQGDLSGACPYLERALTIYEQTLGPNHPDTARSFNNLGELLRSQGDIAGARPYLERALAIYEQVLGPSHPDTALSLNNLGALLQAQGDLSGARPCLERALAIYEQVLGPSHPDTALSLNNLGMLLQAQGDLNGAYSYLERALAIYEQVLGPIHPNTALSLNNLGVLLQAQGDLKQAQPYFERALAIRQCVLGIDHPDTAISICWIADLARRSGNTTSARSHYERALAIFTNRLGPQHPNTQNIQCTLNALDAPQESREEQIAHLTREVEAEVAETLAAGDTEQRMTLAIKLENVAQQAETKNPPYLALATRLRELAVQLRGESATDSQP